jgi:phosphocarrier protein HPr
MGSLKKQFTVKNAQGLHARPAAMFVQVANRFLSRITVKRDEEVVDGKSIMGILMLGAEQGSVIEVEADGIDAESALAELEKIICGEE